MSHWNDTDRKVFSEYTRAIVHMRRQFHARRFGLIFGAGIMRGCDGDKGLPLWKELNEMIAKDSRVKGEALLQDSGSETIVTQRLFEHFRAAKYRDEDVLLLGKDSVEHSPQFEQQVRHAWVKVIHSNLYKDYPYPDCPLSAIKHPYMGQFTTLIEDSPLTVTFNFDDYLEQLMFSSLPPKRKEKTRGYRPICDPRLRTRVTRGVIYHPHGYLPQNLLEASTIGGNLVFSEEEFAERLIETVAGQHAALLQHVSRNTCLFIGLSLEDNNLKLLLRQSASLNPGHCHYYVQHYEDGAPPAQEVRDAIRAANFETYNLITLFLSSAEIAALGKLLSDGHDPSERDPDYLADHRDDGIRHIAKQVSKGKEKELVYCYYIVGAVGAGKSTAVAEFRGLVTFDEWLDPRNPLLGKNWHVLTAEQQKVVDDWLYDQFERRNENIGNEGLGILVVDRCPLDPLSFTKKADWRRKAAELLQHVAPGGSEKIQDGHVILLEEDPKKMALRVIPLGKEYKESDLQEMQATLREIYKPAGASIVDARLRTFREVVRQIARIIHLGDYTPARLHERLVQIKGPSDDQLDFEI